MAIIADFMLVWLPAPTVSLRPPLALSAGPVSKFFYSCPDNAFQVNNYFSLQVVVDTVKACSPIVNLQNPACRWLWLEHLIHFYRE
jgi:hypothetical protein